MPTQLSFLKKLFSVFGAFALLSCASTGPSEINDNGPTRITKIDYKANEIIVYMNRNFSGDFPVLKPAGRALIVSNNSAKYKVHPKADTQCYEFYLKRKGASPSWPGTSEPYSPQGEVAWGAWCFKNPSQAEYVQLTKEQSALEDKLFSGTRKQKSNARHINDFSKACREPKPIVIPEPAPFCSNQTEIDIRENRCYDPGFKRLCKYSLNELLNRQKDKEFSAGLSAFCLKNMNDYRNRDTTLIDAFVAGGQSRILSELGTTGTVLSYGIPAFKVWACLNRLRNTCHPHAPRPPDCNRWRKFKSAKESTSSNNKTMSLRLAEIKAKLINLTTTYKTIRY